LRSSVDTMPAPKHIPAVVPTVVAEFSTTMTPHIKR
jgi:hypothetical protein